MNPLLRKPLLTALLAAGACVTATALAAGATPAQPVPGATVDAGSMLVPALRMILSLGAVLALVAGLAWVAQRLRAGGRLKSGLIEVVSGVSLGAREKVVLLRVGQEQILVGVSPAGMRALHVMKDPAAAPSFPAVMDSQP